MNGSCFIPPLMGYPPCVIMISDCCIQNDFYGSSQFKPWFGSFLWYKKSNGKTCKPELNFPICSFTRSCSEQTLLPLDQVRLEIERTDFLDPKFSRFHFDLTIVVVRNALFLVKLRDEFWGDKMSCQRSYFVVRHLSRLGKVWRLGGRFGLGVVGVRAVSDKERESENDEQNCKNAFADCSRISATT